MKLHHYKKADHLEEDLPNSATIELRWSKDKTTTWIKGVDELPNFMLSRLAEDVFESMPKSKIKIMFWDNEL